jgi:hypothetical protein
MATSNSLRVGEGHYKGKHKSCTATRILSLLGVVVDDDRESIPDGHSHEYMSKLDPAVFANPTILTLRILLPAHFGLEEYSIIHTIQYRFMNGWKS